METKSRRRSLVLAMQLVDLAISMQKEAPPASTLSLRTSVSEVSEIIEAASSLYPRALAKRDMHIKQQRADIEHILAAGAQNTCHLMWFVFLLASGSPESDVCY